jgi:hypothetical protein
MTSPCGWWSKARGQSLSGEQVECKLQVGIRVQFAALDRLLKKDESPCAARLPDHFLGVAGPPGR